MASVQNRLPGPGEVPPELDEWAPHILQASHASGIAPEILSAVMWAESRGRAGEPGGGLMQITPQEFEAQKAQHPELVRGGIDDPASNIMAAALVLKDLVAEYGDIGVALRVYNSGPEGLDPGNLDATPAGTGDPAYVRNVEGFAQAIDAGQPLPP